MKKILSKLHRYLGLIAGLTIFISCLTAAILVYQDEVREWTNPTLYLRTEVQGQGELPISELVSRVNSQLAEGEVESVQIPQSKKYNYVITPSKPAKTQVFVDPYTGKVMGQIGSATPDFFSYAMRLHRWLLDDTRSWGKQIMGASTIVFVLILISGIVYWVPKTIKGLKARLTIKAKASRYRLLSDLHAVGGIYSVCLLLLMALTGLTWSYPWYRSGLYALLGIEEAPKEEKKVKSEGKADKGVEEDKPVFDWDNAYLQVSAEANGAKAITLKEGKATVVRSVALGNVRAMDEYKLDKRTGEVKGRTYYAEQPAHQRARGWIYTLHTGQWAGIWSKTLYFVVCLMGASFPLTGLYLYLQKRKSRKATVR